MVGSTTRLEILLQKQGKQDRGVHYKRLPFQKNEKGTFFSRKNLEKVNNDGSRKGGIVGNLHATTFLLPGRGAPSSETDGRREFLPIRGLALGHRQGGSANDKQQIDETKTVEVV